MEDSSLDTMSLEQSQEGSIDVPMDSTPTGRTPPKISDNIWTAPAGDIDKFLEKRRLIKQVRNQRVLYDSKHPRFRDSTYKIVVWKRISKRLSMEMEDCVDIWAELRYEFQCHVRAMCNYRREILQHRPPRFRPFLLHEDDMMFMYPHVASYPMRRDQIETEAITAPETADDVVLVDTPSPQLVASSALDGNTFRITPDVRLLIDAVRSYPHLYDRSHPSFNDYRHRGVIWVGISNELREMTTELIRSWLTLQTRYEWEVNQAPHESSELKVLMIFLKPHMAHMRDSVYKSSKYLTTGWQAPFEKSGSVLTLIDMLKSNPEVVQLTDEYLYFKTKPPLYYELWKKVASQAMTTPERCEVSWLVLRFFFHELMKIRLAGYELPDKWLFENDVSTIYRMVVQRTVNCEEQKRYFASTSTQPNMRSPMAIAAVLDSMPEKSPPDEAQPMQLAIVHPSAAGKAGFHIPTTTSGSSISSSSAITTTLSPSITTTIVTSVMRSACSSSTSSDSLVMTNITSTLGMPTSSGPTPNALKMSTKAAVPAIFDSNQSTVAKVFSDRSSKAPGHAIRPNATMAAPPVLMDRPFDIRAIYPKKQGDVPVPSVIKATTNNARSTAKTTTSITLASAATEVTKVFASGSLKRPSAVNGSIDCSSSKSPKIQTPSEMDTQSASQSYDIKVEFVQSKDAEYSIHIYGGALSVDYHLNMLLVEKLIQEVMAIPILHNSHSKLAKRKSELWGKFSKQFHMPGDE
ncbi:uncharacterized protein LOC121405530 [Drosophila obscura]|uniref:uncharacterized protein LOC121405530 n=1 Tax=Drosophila obscura TaxID=7282 RepID=UPI001BB22619|nr:uncharacterized protein LOC121405530 [Drosophila obscura]